MIRTLLNKNLTNCQNWRIPSALPTIILPSRQLQQPQRQEEIPTPTKHDWNRVISEGERMVGYPTSFLSLRWLLSDEIANMAMFLRKFATINHPLVKTSKNLLFNGKSSIQLWGLIVLLISKAAGHDPSVPHMELDKCAGILHTQRGLAELTEMIRIAQLVHSSLVNLQKSSEVGQNLAGFDDMSFGNKIGLLIGDYLLSESSVELGKLRNQEVMGLMSSAIRDYSESEFIGERDEQNCPLPSKPHPSISNNTSIKATTNKFDDSDILVPLNIDGAMGNAEKEWELRNILGGGSLLGKSCKGAMKLAKKSEDVQNNAYLFGKHMHLLWQANMEVELFQLSSLPLDTSFSLVSAPILFHLEADPGLYDEIEKGKVNVNKIDFVKIHQIVSQGPGLEKTIQVQRNHTKAALDALATFPNNDTRRSLENILLCIKD